MSTQQGHFGREHVVSGAFVFLLLGIFAVFATAMVLFSAQLYRGTVADAEAHNAHRVAESYLMNQVRRSDVTGGVEVEEIKGQTVLTFTWYAGEESFKTRIYCHNGVLRELFLGAQDEFIPEYGERICAMAAFAPSVENGLLTMQLTHADGRETTLLAALRCGNDGEVAQE